MGRARIKACFEQLPSDPSTIRTLLLAAESAQRLARTALGADQQQTEVDEEYAPNRPE